mmetsp:Transcript_116605/g.267654  ORF Transcript_116605/g.267654 Transcript_116605/m.267654 type:complete len:112 (+) Transcript_116605:218-553(+)
MKPVPLMEDSHCELDAQRWHCLCSSEWRLTHFRAGEDVKIRLVLCQSSGLWDDFSVQRVSLYRLEGSDRDQFQKQSEAIGLFRRCKEAAAKHAQAGSSPAASVIAAVELLQ